MSSRFLVTREERAEIWEAVAEIRHREGDEAGVDSAFAMAEGLREGWPRGC